MNYYFLSSSICLRRFLKLSLILFVISASGGLELFKDGGARYQGIPNEEYDGWLQYINYVFIFFVLFCFCLSFIRKKERFFNFFLDKNIFIPFVYVLFLSLFLLTVGADFSSDIFKSTVLFLFLLMLCGLLVVFLSEREVFLLLQKTFFFMMLTSFFLIFFLPSYGVHIDERAAWQGMFSHKNQLGVFCVIVAVFFLITYKTFPLLSHLNLFFSFLLVIGSKSYTSVFCFFVCILFAIMPYFMRKKLIKYRYFVVFSFFVLSIFLVFLSIYGKNISFVDKDLTFSGRNLIWIFAISEISDSSFFGHGLNHLVYRNNFDVGDFYMATGQGLSSLHNGFLTSFYEFGLFGVFFFLMIFFPLKKNFINSECECRFSFLCYSVVYVLINTFESKGIGFNLPFFILVYFSLIKIKYYKIQPPLKVER